MFVHLLQMCIKRSRINIANKCEALKGRSGVGRFNMQKNLNISLTKIEGLNCMDGLIITILEWLGRNYDILLGRMWDFSFDEKKDGLLGKKMDPYRGFTLKSLEEQCGISLSYEKATDLSLPVIKNKLSSVPVILFLDMFWCPWTSNYYQKIHDKGHAVLATGYNKFGFYCLDYSPRNENAVFPYEYCREGLVSYAIPTIHPSPSVVINDWRDVIKNTINVIDTHKPFENIRAFGRYIYESFDPLQEITTYGGLETNPIIWQMERIANSRELIANILKRLSNEDDVLELANRLNLAKPMWIIIKNLLIKSYVDGDRRLVGRIAKRINKVADYEEEIFCRLKQLYNNSLDKPIFLPKQNKSHGESIVYVDLSKYVNNRAFQTDNSAITPDLTGDGAFILVDKTMQKEELIHNDMVCFKLCNILSGMYDNISCQGQTIELPTGRYRKASFLGCSINGNFRSSISVHYSDGFKQKIAIAFADFHPPSAEFEQEVAWVGVCSKDQNTNLPDFECELYVQHYELMSDKYAVSIKLPDCHNIHIFSIVLYK